MPVRSIKNQYRGLNAHLHSYWQGTNTWNRFHNAYVTHLAESLRVQLLPMGYVAEMEESLQIRRLGSNQPGRPRSDILIYDTQEKRPTATTFTVNSPALTVAELIDEEDLEHPYFAVALRPLTTEEYPGEPIAWIEVLSPTNKGTTRDAETYIGKRRALLDTGVVFIEVDYLHETPPTFSRLGNYAGREPGSNPYRIAVLDPRPDLKTGPASLFEFDVDEPVPIVAIPLQADDVLQFDFGKTYHRMIEGGLYAYNLDYAELPMNFDSYSQADQARIARRMVTVLEAAKNGVDLESGPFPTEDTPLDVALERLETLKQQIEH